MDNKSAYDSLTTLEALNVSCGRIMRLAIIFASLSLLGASRIVGAEAIDSKQKIQFVGRFSNMSFTEEHQYGDRVDLWRTGENIFGHFLHSEGLAGDTPVGEIADVHYNSRSGALSFEAKLTTGEHYCKLHRGVPSQDLFKFKGTLKADSLEGELIHIEVLDDNHVISKENVLLKRPKVKEASNDPSETYGEWQKKSKVILGFRGPKW
jgi:hypothetical protein